MSEDRGWVGEGKRGRGRGGRGGRRRERRGADSLASGGSVVAVLAVGAWQCTGVSLNTKGTLTKTDEGLGRP